jgi:hypothetical protein
MKSVIALFMLVFFSSTSNEDFWEAKEYKSYKIYFNRIDESKIVEYNVLFDNGVKAAKKFFSSPYKNSFQIYVHPSRATLDSTWQKELGMPDFKSECWMVASGVATKMDIISPEKWVSQACEHNYSDKQKTQQLITHEMIHVLHGQHNVSGDFSDVDKIDWFVEGLATYASGQCDEERMKQIQTMVADDKAPSSLDSFWTGKFKYGLAGSMVMYVDRKYGRKKLIELLKFNKNQDLLTTLSVTEDQLITDWKNFVRKSGQKN